MNRIIKNFFIFCLLVATSIISTSSVYAATTSRQITIDNTGGGLLTDFQIEVTLNTQHEISQDKMQADCDDIRFLDSDNSTVLNYFISSECNAQNTKIYVKVPVIPAASEKTIYLTYGDDFLSAMSSGEDTYLYYNDFSVAPVISSIVNAAASARFFDVPDFSAQNTITEYEINYEYRRYTQYGYYYGTLGWRDNLVTADAGENIAHRMETDTDAAEGALIAVSPGFGATNTGFYLGNNLNHVYTIQHKLGTDHVFNLIEPSNGSIVATATRPYDTSMVVKAFGDNMILNASYGIRHNATTNEMEFNFYRSGQAQARGRFDTLRVRKYSDNEPVITVADDPNVDLACNWTEDGGGDHCGGVWLISSNTLVSGYHTGISTFSVASGSTVTFDHGTNITANAMVIDGSMNGNARGLAALQGDGPGYSHFSRGGGGGGYGGAGGASSDGTLGGIANGDYLLPTSPGSGGGNGSYPEYGGLGGFGAAGIILNSNSFAIDGLITSIGGTGYPSSIGAAGGGGAGGSVWITTGSFSGTGQISVDGGIGGNGHDIYAEGGGGGGGRIAVYYTSNTFSGTMTANGGTSPGGSSGNTGTTGTIVGTPVNSHITCLNDPYEVDAYFMNGSTRLVSNGNYGIDQLTNLKWAAEKDIGGVEPFGGQITLIEPDSSSTTLSIAQYVNIGIPYQIGTYTIEARSTDGSLCDTETINVFSGPDITSNLEGYWRLSESSWTGVAEEVRDSSGYGNHGQAIGGASTIEAKFGRGGDFDGLTKSVIVPDIDYSNEISGSVWVNFNSVASQQMIVSDGSEFEVQMQGSTNLSKFRATIVTNSGSITADSSISAVVGEWYHLSWSFDGNTLSLFVNGVLSGSTSLGGLGNISDSAGLIAIGSTNTFTNNMNGIVDELRIYSRALNIVEVNALFNQEALDPPLNQTCPSSVQARFTAGDLSQDFRLYQTGTFAQSTVNSVSNDFAWSVLMNGDAVSDENVFGGEVTLTMPDTSTIVLNYARGEAVLPVPPALGTYTIHAKAINGELCDYAEINIIADPENGLIIPPPSGGVTTVVGDVDVTVVPTVGTEWIYVRDGGGDIVGKMRVDITTGRDWKAMEVDHRTSIKTGGSGVSILYFPGGATNIPGLVGSSFTLYVPRVAEDDYVRICPGVEEISDLSEACIGGSSLAEGTIGQYTVTKVNLEGNDLWEIAGVTGTGGLTIQEVGPPAAPSSLAQYASNGTTSISVGENLNETSAVFEMSMSDSNNPDTLTPKIEVQPIGTDFTNTATNSGADVVYIGSPAIGTVTVTGLSDMTSYHWQAQVCDALGSCSDWQSFGSNLESAIDFRIVLNATPNLPSSLGSSSLVNGGWTNDTTPTLSFDLSDDDVSEQIKYQIQIDDNNDFSSPVVDYTSGFASEGSFTFTVGQIAGSGSYTTGSLDQTLADGSYYWRVKAIDDQPAESAYSTANNGEVSFKVDTIEPTISLNSPGNNSYTRNQYPTFEWKVSSDEDSGMSHYSFSLKNGEDEDINISNIPVYQNNGYENDKYTVKYINFENDSSDDDFVSLTLKSDSSWESNQNDGALREGKRSWKVIATDNVGNQKTETRTLFIDRTSPRMVITQINSSSYADNLVTPDTTPSIFGRITDPLAGDSQSNNSQQVEDNKVASSPKSVEIKVEKQNYAGLYDLYSVVTQQLTQDYWSSDGKEITDNSLQLSDKYSTFVFTPEQPLAYGIYRFTITGRDEADQASSTIVFHLTIGSSQSLFTPEEISVIEETVEQEIEESQPDLSAQEKLKLKEELAQQALEKAVKEVEPAGPSLVSQMGVKVSQTVTDAYWWGAGAIKSVASVVSSGVSTVANAVRSGFSALGQRIAMISPAMSSWSQQQSSWLASVWASSPVKEFADNTQIVLAVIGEVFFDRESTYIRNVQVAQVGIDSAVVSWETNHHTSNNKVNYGTDLSYGQDVIETERARFHQLTITDLEPGQRYVFEVMSEGKNYTYDSHHELTMRPANGETGTFEGLKSTSAPVKSDQNLLWWMLFLALDGLGFY